MGDQHNQHNLMPGDETPPLGLPLPEFTAEPIVDDDTDLPLTSGRSSSAAAPDLASLMPLADDSDQPAKAAEQPDGPRYIVSPADGDLSSYTVRSDGDEPSESDAEEQPSGWQTTWAVVREVGETVILTLVIFLLIQTVVRNFRVVGTSMINNLHDGQYLIIDKLSYNPWLNDYLGIGGPHRGHVVVFEPPRRPDEDYVKRIIGLSGESVQVIKGVVYINGEPLPEPFQPKPGSYTMPQPVIVPVDQVFVLGDNRNNSNDSHNWGPLHVERLWAVPSSAIGRPICGAPFLVTPPPNKQL